MSEHKDTPLWVERLIKPEIRDMHPYHVAPAKGLIKLDAMENPYAWPQTMVEQWLLRLREAQVNRYPDAAATHLKDSLRTTLGLPDSASMVLGNGSDELIQLLVMALAGQGKSVLAPEPSFAMYRIVSNFTNSRYVGVPLRDDWSLDGEAMLDAVRTHRPHLVFMAYPNNPTGNLFDTEVMDAIIRAAPGLVVVDEAYEPFARRSYIPRMSAFPNLVVMRTVSKLGLAGLRLGILVASPSWARELEKLRLPYNINVLSQLTAQFALEHYDVLAAQAEVICRDRDILANAISGFNSLALWPSDANFLLVRVRGRDARRFADDLRREGVLIRVLDGSSPALAGCVRISVGTAQENASLLAALRIVLGEEAGALC